MKKFTRPSISRKELLIVLSLACCATIFYFTPTIWAYLKTPPGFWFIGFNFFYDPWDVNSYLANIRQGFNGRWLYQNPYETVATEPIPIYFFYIFLGHLAKIFSFPILWIYHLASIILTIIFSLFLYLFLAYFVEGRYRRVSALFLILFGGGIGWLLGSKIYMADILSPNITVLQTLHLPHFVLDQSIFLLALLSSFWALWFGKWKFAFLSAISGVFLAFIHTYTLFVVIFIFSGYWLILKVVRKPSVKVAYLVPQLVVWTLTLLGFYILLRQTALFNQNLYFPPFFIFASYGILGPLAILGAVFLWREGTEKGFFLISWFIFQFLALFLPVSFQRLMIEGFFIIIGIMAIYGLKSLELLIKKPWPIYFWVLLLSTFSPISLNIASILATKEDNNWVYLTKEEKGAFDFLLQNTAQDENVLASPHISNFIPANTNNHVYLGENLSISSLEKADNISLFYSGKLGGGVYQFLRSERINYVFWGPEEKKLGDFDLTKESYLEEIYQNEKAAVFKVK